MDGCLSRAFYIDAKVSPQQLIEGRFKNSSHNAPTTIAAQTCFQARSHRSGRPYQEPGKPGITGFFTCIGFELRVQ
jgi:hypothetical protein